MSSTPVQRRLAAILAADVVEYSRMMGRDEVGTLRRLQAVRREVIDPCLAARNGRVVKTTGDGTLAEFASAVEAVAAAVDIQRRLGASAAAAASEAPIVLRIGINLGDILIEDGDVFGDGVNIAARLEAVCQPGGVCVSAAVRDQVRDKLPLEFADLGEHSMKNIARPMRMFALTAEMIVAAGALPTAAPARRPRRRGSRLGVLVLAGAIGVAAVGAGVAWQGRSSPPRVVAAERQAAIAVLPFRSRDGDGAHDYLEDGLTEDIIAALGRFRDLRVISPASVRAYKGKPATPGELGRDLKVGYVVEGSVRRSPEQVRITIGLTDTATAALLWSETYDEAPQNILALQDQIVRRIAGTLDLRVSNIELGNVRAKPPADLAAYDLVLRARDLILRETRTTNIEARALLQQAIDRDPHYAPAYVSLADTYLYAGTLGWTPDVGEVFLRAEALARKAIELDDLNPGGHDDLGVLATYFGDYDRALNELQRAIALNPSDADGYSALVAVQLWRGDLPAALAAGETLTQIQPVLQVADGFHLGLVYLLAHRPADALRVLGQANGLNPNNPFVNAVMAATYAELGRRSEATERTAAVRKVDPGFSTATFGSLLRDTAQRERLAALLTQAGL